MMKSGKKKGDDNMILFVGTEQRGFFLQETADIRNMDISYVENNPSIAMQLDEILKHQMRYIVIDIEQYVDPAADVAAEIERIRRAKNCDVVIYAPGYNRESLIIRELRKYDIKYYIFASTQAGAREEFERCLNGYYIDTGAEKLIQEEEAAVPERARMARKIGVTGVCRRMGTTTAAIQVVKYLQLKGYKACYIEVNETGFAEEQGEYFEDIQRDPVIGRITYESVDMYYKQENLQEVLHQDYDYFVFDYGAYSERGFNKTSFLEKDIRIFVAGSKAGEIQYTQDIIKNEYYTDVCYLFNFISEKEKPDIMEYMEEKRGKTYFTVYTPDQFEYIHNEEFERLLPVEDVSPEAGKKKHGFFGFGKRKRG